MKHVSVLHVLASPVLEQHMLTRMFRILSASLAPQPRNHRKFRHFFPLSHVLTGHSRLEANANIRMKQNSDIKTIIIPFRSELELYTKI